MSKEDNHLRHSCCIAGLPPTHILDLLSKDETYTNANTNATTPTDFRHDLKILYDYNEPQVNTFNYPSVYTLTFTTMSDDTSTANIENIYDDFEPPMMYNSNTSEHQTDTQSVHDAQLQELKALNALLLQHLAPQLSATPNPPVQDFLDFTPVPSPSITKLTTTKTLLHSNLSNTLPPSNPPTKTTPTIPTATFIPIPTSTTANVPPTQPQVQLPLQAQPSAQVQPSTILTPVQQMQTNPFPATAPTIPTHINNHHQTTLTKLPHSSLL